jgi:hypothetical protein
MAARKCLKTLVGARGFEPRASCAQGSNQTSILLARIGFLCVTEHHIGSYSAAFGPKLDPSFFRRLSATDFDPAMVWLSTPLRPLLMDNPRPSRYGKG